MFLIRSLGIDVLRQSNFIFQIELLTGPEISFERRIETKLSILFVVIFMISNNIFLLKASFIRYLFYAASKETTSSFDLTQI